MQRARRRPPRTLAVLGLFAAALLRAGFPAPVSAAAIPAQDTWATGAIRTVLAAGAFPGTSLGSFRPDSTLRASDLAALVGATVPTPSLLLTLPGTAPPALPGGSTAVTMGQMHTGFVDALGLAPDAGAVQRALVRAGLHPRPNAGTEVVTRMLGLTFNHSDDRAERFTSDPATRAEAAWSAAQAMAAVPLGVPLVHQKLVDLVTALDAAPRPAPPWIVRAVSFIGYPYVWGGQWATRYGPDRTQLHGGFDCSGLVWRVVHLVPGGLTSRQLGGRTTYSMAAATPASRRLTPSQLRPGDQILFGDARGARSPVSAIDHTALSLGGSWFIQSSTQGVTIEQLSGSYLTDFAFGRRLPVRGWRPPSWTPPPATPAPAQLSAATLVPATTPGAPQGIHVAWSGSAAPRVSAALLAAPITDAAWAPLTLAAHLPATADTTIPVPPQLTGQPFDVQLLTLRDGQTLGESSAPVTPAPAR